MQQYESEIYEEIMRRSREEGFGQAQDFYGPLLEETQESQYEVWRSVGKKEGYEKGVKDGEERGKTAEREVWETKHGQGRCVEPRTWIRVDESLQTEPTKRTMTDASTQITPMPSCQRRYANGTQRRAVATTKKCWDINRNPRLVSNHPCQHCHVPANDARTASINDANIVNNHHNRPVLCCKTTTRTPRTTALAHRPINYTTDESPAPLIEP
jgi:hypothetical protein